MLFTDFYGGNTSLIPCYFDSTILNIMTTKNQDNKTLPDIEIHYRLVFVFILDAIEYSDLLKKHNKHTIANNLLQLATIWGELLNETRDINEPARLNEKLEQSQLEAKKIKYWLNLCKYSKCYPNPNNLITEINELTELITEISNKSI